MEFTYLAFTRMPGESYRRRLRSKPPLLYLCYVFGAVINSFVCWFCLTSVLLTCVVPTENRSATSPCLLFVCVVMVPVVVVMVVVSNALRRERQSSMGSNGGRRLKKETQDVKFSGGGGNRKRREIKQRICYARPAAQLPQSMINISQDGEDLDHRKTWPLRVRASSSGAFLQLRWSLSLFAAAVSHPSVLLLLRGCTDSQMMVGPAQPPNEIVAEKGKSTKNTASVLIKGYGTG